MYLSWLGSGLWYNLFPFHSLQILSTIWLQLVIASLSDIQASPIAPISYYYHHRIHMPHYRWNFRLDLKGCHLTLGRVACETTIEISQGCALRQAGNEFAMDHDRTPQRRHKVTMMA